jgi:hypothetical protein
MSSDAMGRKSFCHVYLSAVRTRRSLQEDVVVRRVMNINDRTRRKQSVISYGSAQFQSLCVVQCTISQRTSLPTQAREIFVSLDSR